MDDSVLYGVESMTIRTYDDIVRAGAYCGVGLVSLPSMSSVDGFE